MTTSKITALLLIVGLTITLNGQNSQPQWRNVVKTNLLSPLSIGYERGFGQHFSMGIYGLYLPSLTFGTPDGAVGLLSLKDPSTGFTAEARLYTSKEKAPMNGFYLGGYYLFRIGDIFVHKTTTTPNSSSSFKAYIPSDLTSYGLMIGKQKIRSSGFTTDFNFGVGYYKLRNIPTLLDESNESFKIMSRLSKLRSGVGPRINFCLGYGF